MKQTIYQVGAAAFPPFSPLLIGAIGEAFGVPGLIGPLIRAFSPLLIGAIGEARGDIARIDGDFTFSPLLIGAIGEAAARVAEQSALVSFSPLLIGAIR